MSERTLKIRHATEADLQRISEMGEKFWAQTDYNDVPYDHGSVQHWSRIMIDQELLLVVEVDGQVVGSAGALAAPLLGNVSFKVASELFWWIEPEYRSHGLGNALLIALEGAAMAQGVKFFNMIALNAVEPERVAQAYLQRGFKLTEWSFTKTLY